MASTPAVAAPARQAVAMELLAWVAVQRRRVYQEVVPEMAR